MVIAEVPIINGYQGIGASGQELGKERRLAIHISGTLVIRSNLKLGTRYVS
jgi:hypothetical protein